MVQKVPATVYFFNPAAFIVLGATIHIREKELGDSITTSLNRDACNTSKTWD
jgi:hypothetical protein